MTDIHFWCIFTISNNKTKIKDMKKPTYAVFSEKNRAIILTPYPMTKKASFEFFKRFDDSIKMSQVYRYN